jgi:hypothetical protein
VWGWVVPPAKTHVFLGCLCFFRAKCPPPPPPKCWTIFPPFLSLENIVHSRADERQVASSSAARRKPVIVALLETMMNCDRVAWFLKLRTKDLLD